MKKPIYRVFVDFEYKNKGIRTRVQEASVDTFALSKDPKEIEEYIMGKMLSEIKRKRGQCEIKITNIKIEGQYGETSDRY